MAVHYILDGYNIIKRAPLLAQRNLRGGRDGLIQILETQKPQGSARNKVTVVFDGQPGVDYDNPPSRIEIIFTSGQSADDKIKHVVAQADHKKNMIVVTDDNDIRYHVRALGAQVLGGEEFLSQRRDSSYESAEAQSKKTTAASAKIINRTLESQINQELEQIWLRKDKA